MTSNQLENLVQMSRWEMMKMKNSWKQKFPELQNRVRKHSKVRDSRMCGSGSDSAKGHMATGRVEMAVRGTMQNSQFFR